MWLTALIECNHVTMQLVWHEYDQQTHSRSARACFYKRKAQIFIRYRFSAYWLRSSRNNCSLECNSSNWDIVPTLLLQFLKPGMWSEACFAHSAGCPSIAVLLGAAHPLRGNNVVIKRMQEPSLSPLYPFMTF